MPSRIRYTTGTIRLSSVSLMATCRVSTRSCPTGWSANTRTMPEEWRGSKTTAALIPCRNTLRQSARYGTTSAKSIASSRCSGRVGRRPDRRPPGVSGGSGGSRDLDLRRRHEHAPGISPGCADAGRWSRFAGTARRAAMTAGLRGRRRHCLGSSGRAARRCRARWCRPERRNGAAAEADDGHTPSPTACPHPRIATGRRHPGRKGSRQAHRGLRDQLLEAETAEGLAGPEGRPTNLSATWCASSLVPGKPSARTPRQSARRRCRAASGHLAARLEAEQARHLEGTCRGVVDGGIGPPAASASLGCSHLSLQRRLRQPSPARVALIG
jgi:hypothetical protein